MSSIRRHAIFPATVLTVAMFLFAILSARPSAQRIASEFGAAGAPYATPAYCDALPQLLTKFEKTILPQQKRDIAHQEARLAEAEAGRSEAAAEFNNALREGFITLATDQMTTAKVMAERVRGMGRSGMTAAAQKEWLAKIKNIEDTGNLLKVGIARADYAELLKQNQDNLVSFMKFIDDSGASNIMLKGLADLVAPGIGGVVVGGVKVGLDVVYAGLKGRFTAQDAAQWRDNVEKLRSAHQSLTDRVEVYRDDLTGGLCGPKVAQQVQNSPKPIAPEGAAPPPSPAAPPPPPRSGGGMGKVIGWSAIIGGGIVGGVMLAQSELDDLSYLNPPTTTTTTTTTTAPPAPTTNRPATATGAISCAAAGSGNLRTCNGTINVTAGSLLGARQGSSITALTAPSFFVGTFAAPASGNNTGNVAIRATLPLACPTQTQLSFSVGTSGQNFESIQISIPVTCP